MIFYGDGIYNIALITATIYLNSNCKIKLESLDYYSCKNYLEQLGAIPIYIFLWVGPGFQRSDLF